MAVRVLFVCMGNICRSPAAEGAFAALVERHGLAQAVVHDSAGTISYHAGHPPDDRMRQAARMRGLDLDGLRARQVRDDDFLKFDYLLAMDRANFNDLKAHAPAASISKIRMFLEFAPGIDIREVPDPYYGGAAGFDHVLDLVEAGAAGLLAHIRDTHLGPTDPK